MPDPECADSVDIYLNNDLLSANFLPDIHRSLLGIFLHLLTSLGGCLRQRAPEINMADILAHLRSSWSHHRLCYVRLLPGQRRLALGSLCPIGSFVTLYCRNFAYSWLIHGYKGCC